MKHIVPVDLHPDGFILRTVNKVFAMDDGCEEYTARGDMLSAGVALNNQFIGTGYDPKLRILGDFGSTIYTITPKEDEEIESA